MFSNLNENHLENLLRHRFLVVSRDSDLVGLGKAHIFAFLMNSPVLLLLLLLGGWGNHTSASTDLGKLKVGEVRGWLRVTESKQRNWG